MDPTPIAPHEPPRSICRLERTEELAGADLADLTVLFAPLLLHFVEETVGTGGAVMVSRESSGIDGIFLRQDAQKVGSIFARTREAAEALFRTRGDLSVFSEFLLAPDAQPYPVYAAELDGWDPTHRFAHAVRSARPEDVPSLVRLMGEVYDRVDELWLRAHPRPGEHAFVAEIGGRICGAAWVTVVNGVGRLHSLSVAPRYRRLGVGTDLWYARMLFARQAGATRVLTEIAESNVASRAIAAAGGMRRIGQVFEHRGA
jgi:GNAT superfamily N-acetyltransferase